MSGTAVGIADSGEAALVEGVVGTGEFGRV
jgi:hypothetical protein